MLLYSVKVKRVLMIIIMLSLVMLLMVITKNHINNTQNDTLGDDSLLDTGIQMFSDNFGDLENTADITIKDDIVPYDSMDDKMKDRWYSTVMPWLNLTADVHEAYLLSAFWDDRWAEISDSSISTLVFMNDTRNLSDQVQMFCIVQCAEGNVEIFPANMTDIKRATAYYRVKKFDDQYYLRIVIVCKPSNNCERPERVSLGYDKAGLGKLDEENSVLVEYPEKEFKHEFAVCVPPIFGCLNPFEIVEWMEFHKMVGVSKVVIHNNSQCAETSKVFEEYGKQGLVELRQDHTVLPCDDNRTFGGWHMPMSRVELFTRDPLMLTDCMYRHMYDTKYIFFVDLDEILVPETSDNLHDLVEQIERSYKLNKTSYHQLTFKNFFFLLDDLLTPDFNDATYPSISTYLQHRKRLGPSPINGRKKTVALPTRCEYVHNHECPSPISNLKPGAPSFEQVYISEDFGKVHHYRSSPCGEQRGKITCQGKTPSSPVIQDDTILRFKDKLLENVRRQLETFGMSLERILT